MGVFDYDLGLGYLSRLRHEFAAADPRRSQMGVLKGVTGDSELDALPPDNALLWIYADGRWHTFAVLATDFVTGTEGIYKMRAGGETRLVVSREFADDLRHPFTTRYCRGMIELERDRRRR